MHLNFDHEYRRLLSQGRLPADQNIFGPFVRSPTTERGAATSAGQKPQSTNFYEWINTAFYGLPKEEPSLCVLCGEKVRNLVFHLDHGANHGRKWRKCISANGDMSAQEMLALIYMVAFKAESGGQPLSGDEFLAFCAIRHTYPTMEYFLPGPDYPLDIDLISTFSKRVYSWAGTPSVYVFGQGS